MKKIFILLIVLFLAGCRTSHFKYLTVPFDDAKKSVVLTKLGGIVVYEEELSSPRFSLGAVYTKLTGGALVAVLKVQNNSKSPIDISNTIVKAKTSDGYTLSPINTAKAFSYSIDQSYQRLRKAEGLVVPTQIVATTNSATTGTAYASARGTTNYYGNTAYHNISGTGNYNSDTNTQTTLSEQLDPWASLGKQIEVSNANRNIANLQKYAIGIKNHSIEVNPIIEPESWQYYFFFFERPNSYPFKIRVNDFEYEFTKYRKKGEIIHLRRGYRRILKEMGK